MIYGADISRHQDDTVVDQLNLGERVDFIIPRATIGSYTIDGKFWNFAQKIKLYGFKNGYYCASYAKDAYEAREEALFIAGCIAEDGNPPELPVFIDWEYFSAEYIKEHFGIVANKQLVQEITISFCETIKEKGLVPGVYANKDFCDRFYTEDFWKAHPDYKLWYARPGYSKPDKDCYIWQYASDNGAVDFGYNGTIDKNILMDDYLVGVKPMEPLSESPCRMVIGFATSGDIKTLTTKITGLGIDCSVKDGYIVTGFMSSGDQCYIMVDCNALGIPYEIYVPPEEQEKEIAEDENTDVPEISVDNTENQQGNLLALVFTKLIEWLKGIFK